MADTPKSTSILLCLVALGIGYLGWSGDGIGLLGIDGLKERQAVVAARQDTLVTLQAQIDTAKQDLARESVEDVQARTAAYRRSLVVLSALVPEQREVSNILDNINRRAKARGLDVSNFVPVPPTIGPPPFDSYSYQFSVIGRYNEVGAFLTDVASLPRIMVSSDLSMVRADAAKARVFGDTLAMLETRFNVRTYVKSAQAVEDSINGT